MMVNAMCIVGYRRKYCFTGPSMKRIHTPRDKMAQPTNQNKILETTTTKKRNFFGYSVNLQNRIWNQQKFRNFAIRKSGRDFKIRKSCHPTIVKYIFLTLSLSLPNSRKTTQLASFQISKLLSILKRIHSLSFTAYYLNVYVNSTQTH